ncbi:MAG: baseplate assembly protein [Campylobacteraceae bacterium]|nr:baseplate assembly protein [Campylobacteraceae bacterium]
MTYKITLQNSIIDILKTPLKSRVMFPEYGSELYKLRDRTFDDKARVLATKYTKEAIEKKYTRVVKGKKVIKRVEPRANFESMSFDINPVTGKTSLIINLSDGNSVGVEL